MQKEGEVLDRLIEQIYTNLNDMNAMEITIRSAQKTRDYINENGFSLLVDILNQSGYYKKISYDIFQDAVLYPNTKFLKWYNAKHGIESVGTGCIVKGKKKWKELKSALREKELWSMALTLFPSEFLYNRTLPLYRTGFILDGGIGQTGKEHEMLHADHNCYSNVYCELMSWENRKHSDENILFKKEADFADEIISYRNKLRYDKNWVIWGLISDYFRADVNWIKKTTGMKKTTIKKAMMPLKVKVPNAVASTICLMDKLPNKVLTPLLFSVGPTLRAVRRGNLSSSLDDITAWADLVDSGRIKKKDLYKILREKGYC